MSRRKFIAGFIILAIVAAFCGLLLNQNLNSRLAWRAKSNRKSETRRTRHKKPPDIVFFRTSDQPLEWFELCSFYTAAIRNPRSTVKFFTMKNFPLPDFVSSLPNFLQRKLNFSEIFKKTPLMQWFKTGLWKVKDFVKRVRFLSDAVRLAYLYKYGGIYMDTDFVVLGAVAEMKDGLAYQGNISSGNWLANGFLVFNTPHHPFLRLAMEHHKKSFKAYQAEFKFGPALVTKTFLDYEKLRISVYNGTGTKPVFPPVKDYQQKLVYPVKGSEFKVLFRPKGTRLDIENKIASAVTVHLWHNQVKKVLKNPHLIPATNSLLYSIAKKECPAALKLIRVIEQ